MNQINGKTLNRVDGKLKVTGNVKYTSDLTFENMVYGVLIDSAIAHGKITSIDTTNAKSIAGVLEIITYQNIPKVSQIPFFPAGQSLPIMDNENIYYSGQHMGIVVAETLEIAQLAADLIKINYEIATPIITKETALKQSFEPETVLGFFPAKISRGDINLGKNTADIIIEETYITPMTHHNPLETLACIAMWSGDNLTLYDTTQGVYPTKEAMAKIFNIPPENVRVVSEFLGGGFGCKAMVWDYKVIGAIAAKQVKKPVKLVLTRQQMYTSCGYRSETQQHITLGATKEGKLTLISHISESLTSPFDDFAEPVTSTTKMMYDCPNLFNKYVLGRINAGTPTFARAPGETPGMYALESAMDELAYALNLDPMELRLRNYAEVDPQTGHPWSSKSLKECYEKGAELFGWSKRNPIPGSMQSGNDLIGWGMASAVFPCYSAPASAKVQLLATGKAIATSATHDIGTGTYTVMTQVTADGLGLHTNQVQFKLGDTNLPKAPMTGGSMTVSSVAPAVQKAATNLRQKLILMAIADPNSPLYQCEETDISVTSGKMFLISNPEKGETYFELLIRNGLNELEATGNSNLDLESQNYAKYAFGAVFVEVRIDKLLKEIRVSRCLGVYGAGRILNAKTARSQLIGGMTWGISMALMEHTIMDVHHGHILNGNLSDYLIPVNLDIGNLEVHFIPEEDKFVNALGTKGIGEIGIVGVAAAIANGVYHATGKRIRNLPINPDKLLD